MSKGATLGVVKAHREGIVTSASLAVTTPFYAHALETCVRACPELGIGLHFTLTSGKPVSPAGKVPLLVDERGFFRRGFLSLLCAASMREPDGLLDQVALELEAQLQRLLSDGVVPDHIDGERHVHLIPGVFERVVAAAERHRIPFVRLGRDAGCTHASVLDAPGLALGGGLLKYCLLSGLTALDRPRLGDSVQSTERVASYLYTGRLDRIMAALLANPADGALEIMVHPGVPEESAGQSLGSPGLERYLTSPERRAELDACVAARGKTDGWRLMTFAALAKERAEPAIVPFGPEHAEQVAALHCAALTGLLTELGLPAARAYYAGCARAGSAIGFVHVQGGKVRGFVLGSVDPERLRRAAALASPLRTLAGIFLGALRRPGSLPRLIGSFRGPDEGGFDRAAPELTYLAVAPERRGSGLGGQLVDAFTRALRGAGISAYELSVDEENRGAIAFYEARGFESAGRYREFGAAHRRCRLRL